MFKVEGVDYLLQSPESGTTNYLRIVIAKFDTLDFSDRKHEVYELLAYVTKKVRVVKAFNLEDKVCLAYEGYLFRSADLQPFIESAILHLQVAFKEYFAAKKNAPSK